MATTAEATFVKPRKRRRSGLSERRLAAAMVSPSLIVIVVVAAYPIIYAIWLSLHQYSVIHPGLSRWVGLDNYKDAVTSSSFWGAVKTTFVFTIISVALELVIGMGMALLMHAAFRGRHATPFVDGRFRRISPVAAGSGEGPLTEPTAAAQPWRRERVLMPLSRRLFAGVVDEI